MVDNWFMEEVVADIRDAKTRNSIYYNELLMAVVLWDEVYYPKNKYNRWNTVPSQVQNSLKPLDDMQEEGRTESVRELYHYKKTPEEYYWLKWENPSLIDTKDVIGSGAIRYLALAEKHGLNYLPCHQRQEFLRKCYGRDSIKTMLARIEMQKSLTKKIIERFKEQCNELLELPDFGLNMPALADYIIDNTPNNMTPTEFAFHLRHERAVVRYRKYLQEIDKALYHNNLLEADYLLHQSEEAVESVLSIDKTRMQRIYATILPVSSLILNLCSSLLFQNQVDWSVIAEYLTKAVIAISRNYRLAFLRDITRYVANNQSCNR